MSFYSLNSLPFQEDSGSREDSAVVESVAEIASVELKQPSPRRASTRKRPATTYNFDDNASDTSDSGAYTKKKRGKKVESDDDFDPEI